MIRKLSIALILFALILIWVLPIQWRTLSLGRVKASTAGLAATGASLQQGQRVTVQLRNGHSSTTITSRSLFGDGGCPSVDTSTDPTAASFTVPFAHTCKEEKLSGQAVVNYPAGPLSGTLDTGGSLVLDSPITATVTVQITGQLIDYPYPGSDNRRWLEIYGVNDACRFVQDERQITFTPTQWSATLSCQISKLNGSTTSSVYGTGSFQVSFYGGRLILDSRVSAAYSAGNSCPAPTLQNGLTGPAQSCARPSIDTPAEVVAGDPSPVTITAVKADGTVDTSYNGTVQVSLEPGTTDKIAALRSGLQTGATLSLAMEGGRLKQPLTLQTPKNELTADSVLRPGDPPLEGKAVIRAEFSPPASGSTRQEVTVRSPLDLTIDRIEVQQGVVQPPSESFVLGRDLLVRVFIKDNNAFAKYRSIEGITAKLTVKDETGREIGGSPFTLDRGAFRDSNLPEEPFVFTPQNAAPSRGSESLNDVIPALHDKLTLEVKLDDVYPDRNTSNNSKSLGPLTFVKTKPVTFLFSRARFQNGTVSTRLPEYDGISRALEFLYQSYPVRESFFRFVAQPPETLTEHPFANPNFSEAWFWQNRARGADVRAWVYFVDKDYFVRAAGQSAYGLTRSPLAMVDSDTCSGASINFPCAILAHELGHIYSLGDTYPGTVATPSTINPRRDDAPTGNLVENGSFSWYLHRFASPLYPFIEFMGGACPPNQPGCKWIDRVTWNHLKSQLTTASSSLQAQATESTSVSSFVIVQGQVRKDGTARFGNLYTLTGTDLASSSGSGNYVIETLDANNTVMGSLTFTPMFRPLDASDELDQAPFSFALPFSSAVRQLRLRSGSTVLASRTVSAHAPAISFISDFGGQTLSGVKTITWSGSDADGDALAYSLYYSPDGQLSLPLVLETTVTSYAWKTDDYPSGTAPRLTLVATDGVNATTIDSRTFNLPNRAPTVTILAPGNQFQFKVGEAVELEGSLNDPEDGFALNPRLVWSSDIQGALGTGKRIVTANLKAGTHNITAVGTDSQGNQASASVTIVVRTDSLSNLAATATGLDFGTVAVGQTRDLTLSLQNSGNAPFTVSALTNSNPRFVVTTPSAPFSVAARSQQQVTVRFTPLAAGDQTGTLTITSNASNRSSLSVALTGKATGTTARTVATVSAASFSGATLAAESIVAAFGTGLATSTQVASTQPLPTELAGTRVLVRDSAGVERLSQLFFVSPGQINFLIPTGTATGTATIIVTGGDGALSLGTVTIDAVAPGLFTANASGQGVASAVALRIKADGTQSYEPVARFDAQQNRFVAVPIDLGAASDQLYLLLFGTGLRFNSGLTRASCKLGGLDVPVLYAGVQGGFAGLDQVNLGPLPRSLAGRGEVDLVLMVDGQAANTVRVAFAGGPTCSYTIAPTNQSFGASGGVGSVNVTAPNGCAWTAVSNTSFITITNGANGSGNGTVNFSVAANATTSQRTGTLTIAGQTFTVTQAGASACSYTIAPSSQSFPASGGAGILSVTAPSGCAWTATSNASFITIIGGASGTGNGTVGYTVAANTGAARTGTLTVAGQTFTVTQAASGGACSYTLTPANQIFAASGGSGSFNVTTQAGCNWTALTAYDWVVITAGKTGSGSGRVDFTVAANSSTVPRLSAINVAGQSFLVGQTGTGATCRLSAINVGQTLNGELVATDCGSPVYGAEYYADLYYFTASAGQRVAIQLNSSAFDAFLTLIGPDGDVVDDDDDGGGGSDARIPTNGGFLTLPLSGTYIIEASSAFRHEVGAYKLSLSAPAGSASNLLNGTVKYSHVADNIKRRGKSRDRIK